MVKESKIIKFSDFGEVLATRRLGKKIREEIILSSISDFQVIIFDFSQVTLITHSFADECFGKILLSMDMVQLKKRTTFINYNNKVKIQIINSINQNIELKMNTAQDNNARQLHCYT